MLYLFGKNGIIETISGTFLHNFDKVRRKFMYEQKGSIEKMETLENSETIEDDVLKEINMEEDNTEKEKRKKKKRGRRKSVLFLTKELLFYRMKTYFGIELFYIIAAMLVFIPVFNHVSYKILRKVGYSYLTSELM